MNTSQSLSADYYVATDSRDNNPLFVDPKNKDYRLRPESPAIKLGFVSFDGREAGLTAELPTQWRH